MIRKLKDSRKLVGEYVSATLFWTRLFPVKSILQSVFPHRCGRSPGIVAFAGEAVMYLTAVLRLIEGTIGIGDVTYYVSLLTSFRSAYMGIFSLFVEYDDVSEKVSRIREVLDKEPVVE
ncbi:MAG: hypothetical protein LUC95_07155, partial [Lachnospiraceae bacterium]|nr:hypothetical protein [Lachnospiraceae bacterium]